MHFRRIGHTNNEYIEDSVAKSISWSPLKGGGSNFKSQTMKLSGQEVKITKSLPAICLYSIFLVAGLVMFLSAIPSVLKSGNLTNMFPFFLISGIFSIVGVLLLVFVDKPVTFDKSRGIYFRGNSYDRMVAGALKQQGQLSEIYALQLIGEYVRSTSSNRSSSSYTSYEINLVFKNGDRVNVMDHGDRESINESAAQLADFLGVPLWKA